MKSFRKTKTVEKVLNIFEVSTGAISIVTLLHQLQTDMNKTTVYRILERLEERGIIHSFVGDDRYKWFALHNSNEDINKIKNHPHFKCNICGKFDCLYINIEIPLSNDIKIETIDVLLKGKCNKCSKFEKL